MDLRLSLKSKKRRRNKTVSRSVTTTLLLRLDNRTLAGFKALLVLNCHQSNIWTRSLRIKESKTTLMNFWTALCTSMRPTGPSTLMNASLSWRMWNINHITLELHTIRVLTILQSSRSLEGNKTFTSQDKKRLACNRSSQIYPTMTTTIM